MATPPLTAFVRETSPIIRASTRRRKRLARRRRVHNMRGIVYRAGGDLECGEDRRFPLLFFPRRRRVRKQHAKAAMLAALQKPRRAVSSDERGLLAAIVECPDDDVP